MGKILTVVIPTYNMEKYLKNCLDSFIYDEKISDLEILIVNDGSKDNSLSIAREYEQKYPNIFKVIDKENGGHGSTINAGLKVATGKYFKVVDSDDWVDTESFRKLVDVLKTVDVDCIIHNCVYCYENSNKKDVIKASKNIENRVFKFDDSVETKFVMATTTYKTELIKNIKIQEKCFYVDVEYAIYSYSKCETCLFLDANLYMYRYGRVGQSVSLDGIYKHRQDNLLVIKNIVNYLTELKGLSVKKTDVLFNHVSLMIIAYYINLRKLSFNHTGLIDELIDYDNWLKNYNIFYSMAAKNKNICRLRKKHFKITVINKMVYYVKQIIKKILGRK